MNARTDEEDQLRADQANCRHRFKLVGYRVAAKSSWDAVLVCLRCTKEHRTSIQQIPPAPVVEKGWR